LPAAEATITVRARKYDGSVHRTWRAQLLSKKGSLITLDARFDEQIQHDLIGTIVAGTLSLEYYWLDRWYNVFRFSEPAGELQSYYCNITVPPTFDGQVLSYVDLDIDVLVDSNYSYRILDEADFESNSDRFGYSEETRRRARLGLEELITKIESRSFPFNDKAISKNKS
jgi:protein associated with RNAse G/E